MTFNGCTFEKDVDPAFPTNAGIAYLGMTKAAVNNCTFNDNTGGPIELGVAYPPVCNPIHQATTASSLTLTNSSVNATMSQSGPNNHMTSEGGISDAGTCAGCMYPGCVEAASYVYPVVDIESSTFVANYAYPTPPPPYLNSVGVLINLMGNTTFVGNNVSVSPRDYPLVNQYPAGGNAVVNIAPHYQGAAGTYAYSARNIFSLMSTPSPSALPSTDPFEIAYGASQVCADQLNYGFAPTDALADTGPIVGGSAWTAPNLFSQSCPTACGLSGNACCAPSNTCDAGLACTSGTCQPIPPAACTSCTGALNQCLSPCSKAPHPLECECLCHINYCSCETTNKCEKSCSPGCTI